MHDNPEEKFDVAIIGAGPVGLLLGNLLGARGVRVLVAERRMQPETRSMAIGMTPPSLAILGDVGLDAACIAAGVQIERACVLDGRRRLGQVEFGGLPGRYPFILSLPQAQTLRILEDGLRRWPSVTLRRGLALQALHENADDVTLDFQAADSVRATFVAGCDGHASTVRGLLGFRPREHQLGQHFLMADFDDSGELGRDALLFFTEHGSVEAFPLPEGRRRWVAMTAEYFRDPAEELICNLVRERTGMDLTDRRKHFESAFTVREYLCERYHRGRVALCGDAAHVMSPIGGQGMNVGFGDAAVLAEVLGAGVLGVSYEALMRRYEAGRRKAYKASARLAKHGMWIGTRTGRFASRMRSALLRSVLLRRPVVDFLPAYFAMLRISETRRDVHCGRAKHATGPRAFHLGSSGDAA